MVTLFSCIGVHAFRYWSAPVVSESLPCMPISSHHPGNNSVCHGHHREVLSLATVSQKSALAHVTKYFGLVCPIFRRQSCMFYTSLMQHENYRARV